MTKLAALKKGFCGAKSRFRRRVYSVIELAPLTDQLPVRFAYLVTGLTPTFHAMRSIVCRAQIVHVEQLNSYTKAINRGHRLFT